MVVRGPSLAGAPDGFRPRCRYAGERIRRLRAVADGRRVDFRCLRRGHHVGWPRRRIWFDRLQQGRLNERGLGECRFYGSG